MDKNGNLERGDICHICGDYRCGIEGNICEFLVKFNNLIDLSKNGRFQDKWISISERLPEDRNLVLVTAYWHETYQVMQASYFGEGEKNGWWCVPFNNCGEHMRNDLHVIAWQPLPEPYKKEGEEE